MLAEKTNLLEAEMITTWADRMREEGVRQGREEGVRQGREEGLHQLRQLLLRQLTRRFGPLPERVRRTLEGIDSPDVLAHLGERAIEAESLAELGLD